MIQVTVTTRLMEWTVKQPDDIQAKVLGFIPQDMEKNGEH